MDSPEMLIIGNILDSGGSLTLDQHNGALIRKKLTYRNDYVR